VLDDGAGLHGSQTTPEGRVIEALWLSDGPKSTVPSHALYRMAKSRWEIENETFTVAKTAHGLEPMCHPRARASWCGT
jgi:hypothetical protein